MTQIFSSRVFASRTPPITNPWASASLRAQYHTAMWQVIETIAGICISVCWLAWLFPFVGGFADRLVPASCTSKMPQTRPAHQESGNACVTLRLLISRGGMPHRVRIAFLPRRQRGAQGWVMTLLIQPAGMCSISEKEFDKRVGSVLNRSPITCRFHGFLSFVAQDQRLIH